MKAAALFCLTALTAILLVGCGDSPTPVHQPTPTDDRTQIAELKEAAEKGEAKAQFDLGLAYRFGRGVPQDDKEAVKWYRKAAEQGNVDAQFALYWASKSAVSGRYSVGQGVHQDDAEAIEWLRMAAEQEYEFEGEPDWDFTQDTISMAQMRLGDEYRFGDIVPQDYEEAIKWYRKAAEQGYVDAQCCLSFMYYYGEGVIEDKVQAYAWYKIAQANENECEGEVMVGTYEQLAEAKKLVGEMIMASPNLLNGFFDPLP